MPYKYLEDVAIADVAFEAEGKTITELFESSGFALTNAMIKDLRQIEQKVDKSFEVEAEDVEMLLFNFLQELIFYKDAERLLFNKFDLDIEQKEGGWHLSAKAYGEEIDREKQELLADAKAVALHQFKVEETVQGWRAMVIVDV
ncbi:MAG: archease [Candidatus Methanoperedens sp.]|nr:archease [Candidatus Methanoperedens sp.]